MLTLDKVPNNVQLRKIMAHMPVHGRALYLALASSGMRIGEALRLRLGDVDLAQDPARFTLRGEYTKTGNPRIGFISREAREAIEEWLQVRTEWLQVASAKCRPRPHYKNGFKGKPLEDERLFPFEGSTARAVWTNALRKAGFLEKDRATNHYTVHPHVLRKFFRTRLGTSIPIDVVEALMGHEGYLTEVYRRYSEEDLAKFYQQGESALLIFTEAEEVGRLRQEVEERNKQLQILVNGLAAENMELKSRLAKVEGGLEELKKELEKLVAAD